MIDRCKIYVKGGDGGSGCSSVRRSRQDRRGKPDGRCSFQYLDPLHLPNCQNSAHFYSP